MLTGKGEPTLWPGLIDSYLNKLIDLSNPFPLIELQTNGIIFNKEAYKNWYNLGLNTVALSVCHFEQSRNAEIYGGKHYDLTERINQLHDIGFTVRLCCILSTNYINPYFKDFRKMIDFARNNKVEQLTFTPVNAPAKNKLLVINESEESVWVRNNALSDDTKEHAYNKLKETGTVLLELSHGGIVFDIDGQNVCLSNCLKNDSIDLDADKEMRNLIFFSDGKVRFRWDMEGSIIL
jgi:uncharacterized Fe-S cluster-containing radical SAM superfamily enzyme